MAPLIVYGVEISPPVRAVLMTAKLLDINYELREINLAEGEHLKPEYLKMNPQHTIPTIDDNGFILWDSSAICAYLVGKYGKDDSLYPKDLQKRAVVDQRLHFYSGVVFAKFRDLVVPLFRQEQKTLSKEHVAAIYEAIDFIEKFLNYTWLAGEQITIADIITLATITSINSIIPIDAGKNPKVTAWIKKFEAHPIYKVNARGTEEIRNTLKKFLDQ